jgi:hypothetical protein
MRADPYVFGPPGSTSGSVPKCHGSATLIKTVPFSPEFGIGKIFEQYDIEIQSSDHNSRSSNIFIIFSSFASILQFSVRVEEGKNNSIRKLPTKFFLFVVYLLLVHNFMAINPATRGNNKRMWKRARDLETPPDPLSSLFTLFSRYTI